MAGILNGLSSFFRTPEIAVIAAQGVQAADQAARQGLASMQRDASRREHQVLALDQAEITEAAVARHPDSTPNPGSKRRRPSPPPSRGPAAWPHHQVDITA